MYTPILSQVLSGTATDPWLAVERYHPSHHFNTPGTSDPAMPHDTVPGEILEVDFGDFGLSTM